MIRRLSGILLVSLTALPAWAVDCNRPPSSWGNTSAYESWCRECGGAISGSGPRILCIPGPNWGRGGGTSSGSGAAPGMGSLYGAGYQLGYAFGQWLFGGGSDPQAQLQKRLMMEELQRRQEEAERQHREEEARRLGAVYTRLASTLKLGGLPDLKLKGTAGDAGGLRLKTGEDSGGHAGIKGLPGIYLNDGKTPYGIPGLPGIYTGGPGQGSGLSNSKLALKTGSEESAPPSGRAADTINRPLSDWQVDSGLQLKVGSGDSEPAAQAAKLDPGNMTPQQLADVAEMVSKLPPEEQQRIWNAAQSDAAAATVPEDASRKARAGFDEPSGSSTGPPGRTIAMPSGRGHAPVSGPEYGKASSAGGVTAAIPASMRESYGGIDADAAAASFRREGTAPPRPEAAQSRAADSPLSRQDLIAIYLFPGSRSANPFPANPDAPLLNPLREEEKLKAELRAWDDWAARRAASVLAPAEDPVYPVPLEQRIINTGTVNDYAPELLARYESDVSFRQWVDQKLLYAAAYVAPDYYRGIAEARKAAILVFKSELEKLTAAGKLDRLVPLEEQFRLHPERRQAVESIRDRIAADEAAGLLKAYADGDSRLDRTYRMVFRMLREEEAQKR